LADDLALTEIERDFAGDAHFPVWPRGDFEEVERERAALAAPNDFAMDFVRYRRRAARPR
jgi:dihydrofolate reductase